MEPCIRRLADDPGLAAVQPKILSYSEKNKFEYAGAAGGFLDRWGYPFCRGRILFEVEEDNGQYDLPVSLFWATGACLFIRAELFHRSGGFDEDFFAHMEEIDLCWRLKNQGWQIKAEPGSKVYHLGGATLSYQSPKKIFLNFRNSLWMMVKNLPEGHLWTRLLPRMILDGAAAVEFLVSGQFSAFSAVLRAHGAFYKSFGRFLAKRKSLLPLVKQNNHPEIFRGSMVLRFYLLRYRTFDKYRFGPGR
jgi:GT2 family glycosyltransferase